MVQILPPSNPHTIYLFGARHPPPPKKKNSSNMIEFSGETKYIFNLHSKLSL